MQLVYFTERAIRGIDDADVYGNRGFFGLSNRLFDRHRASADFHFYFDEYLYAEELGFDGVALNEHHGTPFCMGSTINIEAAVLARLTSRAKIVLIGNALPNKHPLRVAEELASIDLISKGRLVAGWVRGAGSNQYANNVNPAYNREYFEEAHDFIIQAWTRDGPWRYEGTHFHYRHVNPWVRPYQQPHPPTWIPGLLSPETIRWAAEHRYPYLGLGTKPDVTCDMWDIYADRAAELGYQAGPENFGYMVPVVLADTEQKAQEVGESFFYGGGHLSFARPEYSLPPGYNSIDAIRRLARQPQGTFLGAKIDHAAEANVGDDLETLRKRSHQWYLDGQKSYRYLVGTPDTVLPKVKTLLDVLRPGVLVMVGPIANVPDEDRRRCLTLMGEMLPDIRSYGASIGLMDPFERSPGSVRLAHGEPRRPVVDRAPLRSFIDA